MRVLPKTLKSFNDPKASFLYYALYSRRVLLIFKRARKANGDLKGASLFFHTLYFSPVGKNKVLLSGAKLVLIAKRALIFQRCSLELTEEWVDFQRDLFHKKGRVKLAPRASGSIFSQATSFYLNTKTSALISKMDTITFATERLFKAFLNWGFALLDLIEIKLLKDLSDYDALCHLPMHFADTLKELEEIENNHEKLVSLLKASTSTLEKLGMGGIAKDVTAKIEKLQGVSSGVSKSSKTTQKFFKGFKGLTKSGLTALFLYPTVLILGDKRYPKKTLPLKDIYRDQAT